MNKVKIQLGLSTALWDVLGIHHKDLFRLHVPRQVASPQLTELLNRVTLRITTNQLAVATQQIREAVKEVNDER